MDISRVVLEIEDDVKGNMEERGILESDILDVLADVKEDNKLYVEGEKHFLAKKTIGRVHCLCRIHGVR